MKTVASPGVGLRAETGAEDQGTVSCEHGQTFGGQAVIEGVMMRGKHSWGVAVRRPSGGIARVGYPLEAPSTRHKALKLPIVRGVAALWDSLSLGVKALGISANIGLEDPTEDAADPSSVGAPDRSSEAPLFAPADGPAGGPAEGPLDRSANGSEAPDRDTEPAKAPMAFGWKELAVTVLVAGAMAVAFFIVIPLVVVKQFEETFSNAFVFNLVEGLIRIAIFILYIVGISLIPDLRRVFQYHGAEHKVIHAYESCGRPDAERAGGYSTLHPRCGTGFLLLVMVISVFFFAIIGKPSLPWLVLSRLIGIPIIVGIAYEIGIKWAGKHSSGFFARIVLWPGIQLQRLTTREPTYAQLEVAAAALDEVMRLDAAGPGALAESAARA
jgi:uncharacterized protein YqhQ